MILTLDRTWTRLGLRLQQAGAWVADRLGGWCWIVLLAGLPWALPNWLFFGGKQHLWEACALWAQMGLLATFGVAAWRGIQTPRNLALAAYLLFAASNQLWMLIELKQQFGAVPDMVVQGALHLTVLLLAWLSATTLWTPAFLPRLLKAVAISGCLMMSYSVAQWMGFDPLFSGRDLPEGQELFHGMLGNSSHYGAYLALLAPCLWLQRGRVWRGWSLLNALLLWPASSTAAVVSYLGAGLVWAWRRSPRLGLALSMAAVLVLGIGSQTSWANFSGRQQAWAAYWPHFTEGRPWRGMSLGYVWLRSRQAQQEERTLKVWRYTHSEPYQLAIEQGVVGLGFLGLMVLAWTRRAARIWRTPVGGTLTAIMVAFLLNSLVNFPAHLWALGSFGFVAYAGVYVLSRESTT